MDIPKADKDVTLYKEADSGREEIGKERAKAISCRGDENLWAKNLKNGGGILENRNIHMQFIQKWLKIEINTMI